MGIGESVLLAVAGQTFGLVRVCYTPGRKLREGDGRCKHRAGQWPGPGYKTSVSMFHIHCFINLFPSFHLCRDTFMNEGVFVQFIR